MSDKSLIQASTVSTERKTLQSTTNAFKADIDLVIEFSNMASSLLGPKETAKLLKPKLDTMDSNERGQLIQELQKVIGGLEAAFETSEKFEMGVAKPTSEMLLVLIRPIQQRRILAEMTVVYLMAKFEDFTKSYLRSLLVLQPNSLKSKKSLSYLDVIQCASFEKLIDFIASKETEELGRGSIDDVHKFFEDKFNILLSESDSWEVIREAHYRRNIIVHNAGRRNPIYNSMNLSESRMELAVDSNYAQQIAEGVIAMSSFIDNSITNKFNLS